MLDTKHRTLKEEIMDDFNLQGEELREALDQIAIINRLLGGNGITLDGIRSLIKNGDTSKELVIVDLGCGNGDMLRKVARFANENDFTCKLVGIDANAFAISHARALSKDYPLISYEVMDIFSDEFTLMKYDIALCTLTLHHFKEQEIIYLLKKLSQSARLGVVINDLHRSWLAYRLFQLVCYVFRLNDMSKDDGLVSILRGFKRSDLESYGQKLNLKNYNIRWKWAFRFQWIISTI